MAEDPRKTLDELADVPPAPSPGGASAAEDFVARARGRVSGSTSHRGRVPRDEPDAPAQPDKAPLTASWKLLREGVMELYTAAEMLCFMADPATAQLISANKGKCADAWIELARQDKRVEKLLRKLTQGAGWGAVVMAHVPILLPVLMRKGIMPGGALFGGAPFNAMAPEPEGPAPWPGGIPSADLFNGHVTFGQNGA